MDLKSKSSLSDFTASFIVVSGKRSAPNPWIKIFPLKLNSQKAQRASTKNSPLTLLWFLQSLLLPQNYFEISRYSVGQTIDFLHPAADKGDTVWVVPTNKDVQDPPTPPPLPRCAKGSRSSEDQCFGVSTTVIGCHYDRLVESHRQSNVAG